MGTPGASDMAQFFDFGEAAMPDVPQKEVEKSQAADSSKDYTSLDYPEGFTNTSNVQSTGTDFNTDFSSWLPRYQKPTNPCDYCRSKSLECFIYNAEGPGQLGCSPCNALFRPCSFSNPEKMPALKQRTALDTLDVVAENDPRHFGGLTGKKQMRSLGHMGPIDDDNQGEQGPKKGAAAARFPRAAIKILKDWMLVHIEHPYPTDEEKEELKQQTGLSVGQISNWMANTRRRQKTRPKRSASPSIRPSTEVIDIPPGRTWESLNPFERWKHSPPENEPAPMTAIAQAVETFDLPETTSISSSYRKDTSNDSTGSFSVFKAPSISSLETGLTNMSSGSLGSHTSAYSYGSRHSLGSMNSLKSKERRRRRRLPNRAPKVDSEEGPRLFQCTFCTDRFKSKYDWSRHEKSLHLSLEKWLCAPIGEIVADKATGKPKCVYCDALDPSSEHLATHNHTACFEKGPESRTFYRKDHLRQHLRLMHGCKMTTSMESWKSEAQFIKSRCGFCGMTFDKWQDRIDHLAKEFRNGANMKDWKGCRGLDPHVAIHVSNAMPPYLIANESKSPFPFSASNSSSLKQLNLSLESKDIEYLIPNTNNNSPTNDQFVAYQDGRDPSNAGPIVLTTPQHYSASSTHNSNPNATCWEILTLRLGRFARQHIEKHGAGSVTDEMLQRESRGILYGEPDDPWNQTAADNPEWLNLFKKAHGIETKVPVTGITSHHEVYEDLGIHSNTIVDQSFNVNNFPCEDMSENDPGRALAFECSLSGSTRITDHVRQLSSGRQSPYSLPGLAGSVSASPTSLAFNTPQLLGVHEPISEMTCTGPGGPCYGESGEVGFCSRDKQKKKRYWLDSNTAKMAPSPTNTEKQRKDSGERIYECPKVGLRSFSPITEQECTASDFLMPTVQEKTCTKSGDPISDDFQFPSWDQLPADFQNPTTSADYNSTIPVSTTGVSMPGTTEVTSSNPTAWDDNELNFTMDMDLDFDLDLNVLEK
ncbi:Nn.00g046670.m01.CDS01 [Neocucurbitaria sp. VM-36]